MPFPVETNTLRCKVLIVSDWQTGKVYLCVHMNIFICLKVSVTTSCYWRRKRIRLNHSSFLKTFSPSYTASENTLRQLLQTLRFLKGSSSISFIILRRLSSKPVNIVFVCLTVYILLCCPLLNFSSGAIQARNPCFVNTSRNLVQFSPE